jgi:hypothetical protein
LFSPFHLSKRSLPLPKEPGNSSNQKWELFDDFTHQRPVAEFKKQGISAAHLGR